MTMPPPDRLPDDLEEIARSIPGQPRGFAELRRVMSLLPNPLAPFIPGSSLTPLATGEAGGQDTSQMASPVAGTMSGEQPGTQPGWDQALASAAITDAFNNLGVGSEGFGAALVRYLESGIYNSDFLLQPRDPASNLSAANPLPFWTFVQSSGVAVTAKSVARAAVGSGRVLEFSMVAGAADDQAYIEQIIPIRSSLNRATAWDPYGSMDITVASADAQWFVSLQFLKYDLSTTGTAQSLFMAASVAGASELSLTGLPGGGGNNTSPPADAYWVRIRIGLQRKSGGAASATATIQFIDIAAMRALNRLTVAEVDDPTTWRRSIISQRNGKLILTPHGVGAASPTFFPQLRIDPRNSALDRTGGLELNDLFLVFGGTSFPANAVTGDLYFRTDLGGWCKYDGSAWQLVHPVALAEISITSGSTAFISDTAIPRIGSGFLAPQGNDGMAMLQWYRSGTFNALYGVDGGTGAYEFRGATYSAGAGTFSIYIEGNTAGDRLAIKNNAGFTRAFRLTVLPYAP